MAKESKSTYALLGALSIQPMSGYDVRELIGRSIGHFWNEGYGQIYPTLKRLVTAGLATSRVEPGAGKPDRHLYTLTDAGWDELRRWLAEPVDSLHPARNEVLLKLFFGRHAAVHANLDHVRRYREVQAALLVHFEAIEAALTAETPAAPELPYWLITLRHGQHLCRATLAWCDETTAALAATGGGPPAAPPVSD